MGEVLGFADRATPDRSATIVGAGVTIRGDIEGVTDLHVQGSVIGKVAVADLRVDDDALIDGPVTAEAVAIGGRVTGPIHAKTVHLHAAARVRGDISCDTIQIDVGARFNGRCQSDDAVEGASPGSGPGDEELGEAGQELLRLAARLRKGYPVDDTAGRAQRGRR